MAEQKGPGAAEGAAEEPARRGEAVAGEEVLEEADAAPAGADCGGDEGCHAEGAEEEVGEFGARVGEEGAVAGEGEDGEEEGEEFEERGEGGQVVGDCDVGA